jgi:hypothetical protein
MVKDKKMPLSKDAALVTALAGTAMPFSHSAEDQAERWLRAMRLHGEVGNALQALGVGESSLFEEPAEADATPPFEGDVVQRVVDLAGGLAAGRSRATIGTADLLLAVLEVYDDVMDRALYMRGTSRDELAQRLAETA